MAASGSKAIAKQSMTGEQAEGLFGEGKGIGDEDTQVAKRMLSPTVSEVLEPPSIEQSGLFKKSPDGKCARLQNSQMEIEAEAAEKELQIPPTLPNDVSMSAIEAMMTRLLNNSEIKQKKSFDESIQSAIVESVQPLKQEISIERTERIQQYE